MQILQKKKITINNSTISCHRTLQHSVRPANHLICHYVASVQGRNEMESTTIATVDVFLMPGLMSIVYVRPYHQDIDHITSMLRQLHLQLTPPGSPLPGNVQRSFIILSKRIRTRI